MSDELELPSLPVSDLLAAIDAQQDDVLRQLDQLNDRLELILKECTPPKASEVPPILALRAA